MTPFNKVATGPYRAGLPLESIASPADDWHVARLAEIGPSPAPVSAGPATFVELTGTANPFNGIDAPGGNGSVAAFVDVDGDGDLDLVLGGKDASLAYYRNQGGGSYVQQTGAANPFDAFDLGTSATYSAPAAIDVDGDGDLDLVVGSNYGDLAIMRNNGNGTWTQNGFVAGVTVSSFSVPTAVNLDGDGDLDLVVGSNYGFVYGFRNNGGGSFTELTGPADPFAAIDVGNFAAPAFADLDGDGDFDMVVGDYSGGLSVFTNNGTGFVPAASNPFSGFTFASIPAFVFVDLDGDGDLDGVAGSVTGALRTFQNTSGGTPPINGSPNPDTLSGTTGDDVINGLGGNDLLSGLGGNDTLNGGEGNDRLGGGVGADTTNGGPGDDSHFVDNPGDVVGELAGEGSDVVAASVSYVLTPGASVELMTTGNVTGTAPINLTGNELANQIWGNNGVNILSGGDGYDELFGFAGDDELNGGGGADALFGGLGNDTLRGGLGVDTYFIDDLGDVVVELAGEGSDVLAVGFDYVLAAGVSVELMTTGWIGGTASIDITGNSLSNEIWGNDGTNHLNGGNNGNDALFGFGGNDRLEGGMGYDLLAGGTGQDVFVFGQQASSGIEADIIIDFVSADDTIEMDHTWYTALSEAAEPLTGVLKASAFVIGTAALDADDRIIYNQTTGQLFYDPDGNGSTAGYVFATVNPGTVMTAADFLII